MKKNSKLKMLYNLYKQHKLYKKELIIKTNNPVQTVDSIKNIFDYIYERRDMIPRESIRHLTFYKSIHSKLVCLQNQTGDFVDYLIKFGFACSEKKCINKPLDFGVCNKHMLQRVEFRNEIKKGNYVIKDISNLISNYCYDYIVETDFFIQYPEVVFPDTKIPIMK